MNQELVDRIVRAVLYEGYILYPYRPSVKNRQRWTFGGIYPRAYSEAQRGSDAWRMQAQCLLVSDKAPKITLAVRFLHLAERTVERIGDSSDLESETSYSNFEISDSKSQISNPKSQISDSKSRPLSFRRVPSVEVGGRIYQEWQEAIERTIDLGEIALSEIVARPCVQHFAFGAGRNVEPLREGGRDVGRLVRQQQPISGEVEVCAEQIAAGTYQLTVRVVNESSLDDDCLSDRDAALMRSLVSTHMILGVRNGRFISPTEPPEPLKKLSDACRNVGCWPVLVGEAGETDTLLVSPIILYDYPHVAPESPGDLFDGCEIDEILTLRIMTLTDEEKRQAAATDPLAAQMLARTRSLAREQLMNLHGAMRGVPPPASLDPLATAIEEHHA